MALYLATQLPLTSWNTLMLMTRHLEHGNAVDVITLDSAKAFDKVPRKRLLVELDDIGVGGDSLSWIDD